MVATGVDVNGVFDEHSPLEAQLQATLNVIPAYTWYANPSGGLTFVNKRQADYLGLPKEHPLRSGMDTGAAWDSHLTFLHPDDQEHTRRIWSECLRTGSAIELSFRVRNGEGAYRWFLCRAEPVRAANGTLLCWIGVNLDIEERKQAEFELRRGRGHLADAQKLSRTGCVGMERSTKRIFWSEEAARIYGYPPGTEPTPELILQRSHPDDVGLLKKVLERAAQGVNDFDWEHRLLMPDGSIKHLHDLAHCFRDEAGNEEIVGAIMDITEHKLADEGLRKSEERFRLVLDSIGAHVIATTLEGELEFVNQPCLDYFGKTLEELKRWQTSGDVLHPDDLASAIAVWRRSIEKGVSYDVDHRFRRYDGVYRWFHVRGRPQRDAKGSIVRWYALLTDIDERKKAEQKLEAQEMELRQVLDLTPQLIAVFGPHRERLFINRMALDYFGLTVDEWRDTAHGALGHPDDTKRVQAQ